jgi:hypothetical protein
MQALQDYDRWQVRRASAVRSLRRRALAGFVAVAFLFAPSIAFAEQGGQSPSDGQVIAKEAGLGIAAGVSSLIYTPLKLVYSFGGVLIGSLAWVFSGGDSAVAKIVMTPAAAGDYVLTPRHLTGEETLEFFGREPGYRPDEEQVVANSSAGSNVDTSAESNAEIAGLPSGW